jgi:Ser/Thr protein kinase RdoA (MazF antagonist)
MTSASTEAGALDVLHTYPLRAPIVLDRIASGYMNDNWLALDEATGERYVLRKYRFREFSRIEFQLSFQEHLHASAFPTAPIIRTGVGALLTPLEGSCWSLSRFIEGDIYDFSSLAQAIDAGRRLAQFQAVAKSFSGPAVELPDPDVAFIGSPLPSYAWRATTLTDAFDARLRKLYLGQEYEDDIAFFSAWRRAAADAWPAARLAALPQSSLHCDYHGRNMVFRDDRIVGVFDFDFVSRGPRVYDVARGIYNFGREYRGSTSLREAFCSGFLEGYESESPLTDEERRSLPFMAVLNWAPDAALDARQAEALQSDVTPSRLHSAVRLMRAIESEMRRLAPVLGWGDA